MITIHFEPSADDTNYNQVQEEKICTIFLRYVLMIWQNGDNN